MKKKDLPDGWELGKIIDFARNKKEAVQTGPFGAQLHASDYVEDGIPLILIKNIANGKIDEENIPRISPKKAAELQRYSLKLGDIVFSRVGSVGRVAVVQEHQIGWLISGQMLRVRLENPEIDTNYLRYMILSRWFIDTLELNIVGTTRKSINTDILKNLPLICPPLETQRKIVAILEKAEATQRLREEVDVLTQELVQSVFLEMFGDPVTNPMGWKTIPLERLCTAIFGGGTPTKSNKEYYKGNIPWVTPKDMKTDFIRDSRDHITEKAVHESATRKAPEDSLLMVIRSGILKKKLPVAISKCEVTINQDMKAFVFDQSVIHPYFMLYFFKNYQKYLLKRVRSVTADNLEFDLVRRSEVMVPPIEIQKKFAKIVGNIHEIRDSQRAADFEEVLLEDSLMSKTFTGDLFA